MQSKSWDGDDGPFAELAGDLQVFVCEFVVIKIWAVNVRPVHYLCEHSVPVLAKTPASVRSAGAFAYKIWLKNQHV